MDNISDGQKDGFVLMYCKNGVIYPVTIDKKELEMIDIILGTCISKVTLMTNNPVGKAIDLTNKK